MPGDIRTIEWPVLNRRALKSNGTGGGGGNGHKQEDALSPPNARVRLELMCKSGWLGRTKLIAVLAPSAPDNGLFEFAIPLTAPPSKHYFVRLTLLPPSSGSSSDPIVTETAPFEVVPLQAGRKQSNATAGVSAAVTQSTSVEEKQQERVASTPQPVRIAKEPQYLSTPRI